MPKIASFVPNFLPDICLFVGFLDMGLSVDKINNITNIFSNNLAYKDYVYEILRLNFVELAPNH